MIGNTLSKNHAGLVLLAQGNQDLRWQKPFAALKKRLADTMGHDRVFLAYLEACTPTLLDVAREVESANIAEIIVLPLFLALGGQMEIEIPHQVVQVKEQFPQLSITLLPPIGEHPSIADEIYYSALKILASKQDTHLKLNKLLNDVAE